MEAFTTVVEQGGFTGAAKKLGISKSAVSKHVSSLEGRLGVRLLERTTRRVAPTDIGLVYYDRAKMVLGAAIDADQMVSSKTLAPEGPLSAAMMDDTAMRFVGLRLNSFLIAYPRLSLKMTPAEGHVELIKDGFDLSVATGSVDGPMQSQKLADVRFRLVASPGYLERQGRPERIEDLASHALLHLGGPTSMFHLVSHTGERRAVHTGGRLVVRDTMIVMSALEDGLGIGFLPDFVVADGIASGWLADAMPDLPPQASPVFASFPQGEQTNPKVRAFLEHFSGESGSAVPPEG
jgi:DNA-binding transcriptional LysR family regulator